jgi:cytochrome c551/c552
MQASGVDLGRMSSTIAQRIRAQADELTRLANETRAGSQDAAKQLRQIMQPT